MATVRIPIIVKDDGTFISPPNLQQVPKDDHVKWVAGAGVRTFRVKFKNGTPFEDDAFDIDNDSPHKATKKGPYTYAVHVTSTSGAVWSFGGCPEIDVL